MDLKKIITNYKWVFLLLVYVIALSIQFYINGKAIFATAAGIGLIVAIVATIFNNSSIVKKTVRKIKYFFGYGMFKWEATAVFTVRKEDLPSLASEEKSIIEIAKNSLEHNDHKADYPDAIQTSFDKLKNLKVLLEKYVMYLNIMSTDADLTDENGDDLVYITIKTNASLRYKDNNKAINGILLDFYHQFDKHYKVLEQKYTVKIQPENISKDFLKKHFINEYEASEIDTFSITSKKSKSTIERVNQSLLTLTTDRREELHGAIKDLILKLS